MLRGWSYFIAGFGLIFRRGIRRYVILPLCINVIFYTAMIWVGVHEFQRLTAWVEHLLPGWLQWLGILLWLLFGLLVIFLLIYTFTLLANIVAAPFNGFLSEKVEEVLLGRPLENSMTWVQLIKEAPRMIGRQLQYVAFFLVCALGVLLLFFIPGLHLVVVIVWYALGAWLMGMQYIDYPMDNHRVDFKKMRILMGQKRGLYFTFGGLVLLASMIPILNLLVIPAAVAGATKLWVVEYTQHR